MSLYLSRDDEPLSGLEALPFRLMQQDCTAVKTLLLRLRRTLQEVMFHPDSRFMKLLWPSSWVH